MCEECGFDSGVHEKGCWATMTREQQEALLASRGWPPTI